MRDGVAIAGQTGLTYTYNSTTDDGCYITCPETNGGSTVTSNALITARILGTPVAWNPADKSASITLSNNNLTAINTVASNQLVRANTAVSGKRYFEYTAGATANSTIVGVAPPTQPVADWVGDANGGAGYSNNAGVFLDGGTSAGYGATWTSGDVIGVAVDSVARKIWFAKNNTWQSGDPNTGTGGTTLSTAAAIFPAWSASNTTGTGYTNFGGSPFAYALPTGFSRMDANLLAITIRATSVSPTGSPTGQPRITASGKTDGTPTQLQAMVMSAGGAVLLNWTDVSGLVGSDFTITTADLPTAAQGTTVTLWVRDKTTKNTATSSAVAVGYYATIFPSVIGLNEDFWYPFGQANPFVDYGSIGEWYSPTAPGSILPTGNRDSVTNLPISYYGSDTYVEWAVGYSDQYNFLTAGAYVITYPPGMTATAGTLENATVTTPFSGGSGVITVSGVSGGVIRVRLSGTFPAGGASISMKKQGETSTKLYTSQIATDYTEAGFKIARFMTPFGTNTLPRFPITSSTLQYNSSIDSAPGLNPAYMVQFCNDNAVDLYFNVHHLADDTYVTAAANYFAANLNTNRKIYIEFSNEMWNSIFPVHDYSRMTGSALGFYNTLGNAAPSTIVAGQFDPSTGVTSAAYTTGTRIFGNLYGTGWQVWEAVGNQPIGSVLAATSNANWTVIATNAQTATAGRRWQAKRSKEVFALFDTAFGGTARSRTVRVLGAWAAGDTVQTLGERLQWGNLYQGLDRIAIAPYWGNYLGEYSTNNLPGWGATEKALYATDVAAWKNAFFSVVNADIDATVAAAATFKQNLEAALRVAPYNLPANTIRLMSYECGWHVTMGSYPNQALAVTAFNSLRDDARYATATTRYLNAIKAQLGGEHVWFSSVTKPIPGATGNIFAWGIMYKQGDRTMPLYNAIKTWIAGNT